MNDFTEMSEMNKRLDELVEQVRAMKLTTNELVVVQRRHSADAHKSRTSALVEAAATLVLLERCFANPKSED